MSGTIFLERFVPSAVLERWFESPCALALTSYPLAWRFSSTAGVKTWSCGKPGSGFDLFSVGPSFK